MTKTISLVHGNGGEENNELRDIFPRSTRLKGLKELRKLKYPTSFSEAMACLRQRKLLFLGVFKHFIPKASHRFQRA